MCKDRTRPPSFPLSTASRRGQPRDQAPELDDNQRCVSAPAGCLLAAKSERVRLPNTSPNFRARALKNLAWGTLQLAGVIA